MVATATKDLFAQAFDVAGMPDLFEIALHKYCEITQARFLWARSEQRVATIKVPRTTFKYPGGNRRTAVATGPSL